MIPLQQKQIAIFASLFVLLQLGCSNEDAINGADARIQTKPLWTIHGHIQDGGNIAPEQLSNVHAAIVWQRMVAPFGGDTTKRLGGYQVAQTLPVNVQFPVSFELGLYELPPEDVLLEDRLDNYFGFDRILYDDEEFSWGEDPMPYKWTVGYLVMFQDGNNNGTLDMVEDGESFVDTVIGSAPNYTLLYIESEHDHPVAGANSYTRGLSIYKGVPENVNGELIPLSKPIAVSLATDLLNQAFMCPNGHNRLTRSDGHGYYFPATCGVVPSAEVQNHFPGMVINGRDGFCDASGRTFTWYEGASSYPTGLNDLCSTSVSNQIAGFSVSVLDEEEVPPAWWPCNDGTGGVTFSSSLVETLRESQYDFEKYKSGELTKEKYEACAEGNWNEATYDDGKRVNTMSCSFVFEDWVACVGAIEAYMPAINHD